MGDVEIDVEAIVNGARVGVEEGLGRGNVGALGFRRRG
jgi:hypothetical protein